MYQMTTSAGKDHAHLKTERSQKSQLILAELQVKVKLNRASIQILKKNFSDIFMGSQPSLGMVVRNCKFDREYCHSLSS